MAPFPMHLNGLECHFCFLKTFLTSISHETLRKFINIACRAVPLRQRFLFFFQMAAIRHLGFLIRIWTTHEVFPVVCHCLNLAGFGALSTECKV